MPDYINRNDAIAALCKSCGLCEYPIPSYKDENSGCDGYLLIKSLPAANVATREIGEWTLVPNGNKHNWKRQCSVCGKLNRGAPRYCPQCGAKMRCENER